MLISNLIGGELLSMLLSMVTFLVGLVVGLYFEDYREDRDWCRRVEETMTDISMSIDEIRSENKHNPQDLQRDADRIDEVISETPAYRHTVRRELEQLQEELDNLAETEQWGPPIGHYDHDDDTDSYGDLDRIDYIIERGEGIENRAYEINHNFSYGLFRFIPKFLYYNLVPSRLRDG